MTKEELVEALQGEAVHIGDVMYSTVIEGDINILVELRINNAEQLINTLMREGLLTEAELATATPDEVIELVGTEYDYDLEAKEYGLEPVGWFKD